MWSRRLNDPKCPPILQCPCKFGSKPWRTGAAGCEETPLRNPRLPYTENMFVTPKEVDEVTDNLANIIANGINIAIQPPIENDDINKYK